MISVQKELYVRPK